MFRVNQPELYQLRLIGIVLENRNSQLGSYRPAKRAPRYVPGAGEFSL
jgi:hypothetical protein